MSTELTIPTYVDFKRDDYDLDPPPISNVELIVPVSTIRKLNKMLSEVTMYGDMFYVSDQIAIRPMVVKVIKSLKFKIKDVDDDTDLSHMVIKDFIIRNEHLHIIWRYDDKTLVVGMFEGARRLVLKETRNKKWRNKQY